MNNNADAQAAQAADLRIDAERGKRLIEFYQAKWHEEGYAAFISGVTFDKMWSHAHRAGWTAAEAEREAAILEKMEKPSLDATPWQVPEELSEEYLDWLDSFLAEAPEETEEMAAWRRLEAGALIPVAARYPFADELAGLDDEPGYDFSTRPYLY